jgi:hypothetical protein
MNKTARLLLMATTLIPLAASNCPASDPGKEGPATPVVVQLTDGSKMSEKTYGIWHAADGAPGICTWKIIKDGKTIASGSKADSIIAGTATKGGILHTSCGSFHK